MNKIKQCINKILILLINLILNLFNKFSFIDQIKYEFDIILYYSILFYIILNFFFAYILKLIILYNARHPFGALRLISIFIINFENNKIKTI